MIKHNNFFISIFEEIDMWYEKLEVARLSFLWLMDRNRHFVECFITFFSLAYETL